MAIRSVDGGAPHGLADLSSDQTALALDTDPSIQMMQLDDAASEDAPIASSAELASLPHEITPDFSNTVRLPEGVSLDEITVEGPNLVLVQADGSRIVVLNAALNIPTFVIGEVELTPEVLAAVIEAGGMDIGGTPSGAAHGMEGSGNLAGQDGMDFLFDFEGEDILIGELGQDDLVGGVDSLLPEMSEVITDFNPGAGDQLDLSELLKGIAAGTDLESQGYVKIDQNGPDAILSVDPDGGGNNFHEIAVLQNFNSTAEAVRVLFEDNTGTTQADGI